MDGLHAMNLGLNLGLSSRSNITLPSEISDLSMWYKVGDTATLDNQTIGGQVDSIQNRYNAGTQDATNYVSSVDPYLFYGANGKLCLSTLSDTGGDARNADFRSSSNIIPPYTVITAATLYNNPTVSAQVYAGPVVGGTLKRRPDEKTVFSLNQASADEILESGSPTNKMVFSVIKAVSASEVRIIWDIDNGTETTFDPRDSSIQGAVHRLFGFYNGGTGGGEVGYHEGLLYAKVLSDEEVDKMVTYMRSSNTTVGTVSWTLLAGQSNAGGSRITGFNGTATGYQSLRTLMYAYDGNVKQFVNPVSDATDGLYSVFDTSGNGLSYSMSEPFADYMANRLPEKQGIIPASQGGTSLAVDWQRNESDHFDTTTLYGAMITRVAEVVATGGSVDRVIWQHGEADAAASRSQAQYKADLTTLINNFRADTGLSIPWSIGVISDDLPIGTYITKADIKAAQLEFAAEAVLTNVFVADTSDSTNFPTGADNIHYSTAGYKAVGIAHGENFA
jgi:hypothetical protein